MEKYIKSEFYKHEISKEKGDKFDTTFVLEPVNRGFGNTLGNALRRTLISNVLGASVYAIEVKGAKHEFTGINNVSEDVVQIILSIKNLAIKFNEDAVDIDERLEMTLKSTKKGKVTAADIETPAELEIINKDLFIAEVSEADALDIKLYVRIDVGFQTFMQNREYVNKYHGDKGLISIDSNFSPVISSNYKVEKYQVGAEKEQEKIIFNVVTNGTLAAEDAVAFASKILINYLNTFFNLTESSTIKEMEITEKIKDIESDDYKMRLPISELNLSARSFNSLKLSNIETLQDLEGMTIADLENVKNLGQKSLIEIVREALRHGIEIEGHEELLGDEEETKE